MEVKKTIDDIYVSIFGDCVTHNIAASIPHKKAIGLMNWLSVLSRSPIDRCDLYDNPNDEFGFSNYFKRVCNLDLNKKTLEYLFEEKADYLLLDANDCRKRLISFGDTYITDNSCVKRFYEYVDGISTDYRILNGYDIAVERYRDAVNALCSRFLEVYDEQQIIIHEHYIINSYLGDDILYKYSNNEPSINVKSQRLINKVNEFIKEALPNAHVIPFPDHVLGWKNSPLGLYPLHYLPLYNEYGRRALQIIFEKRDDEVERLNELKELFSLKFQLLEQQADFNGRLITLEERMHSLVYNATLPFGEALSHQTLFLPWLDTLFNNKNKCIICYAIKDTFDSVPENILHILTSLGVTNISNKLWMMQAGIIWKGETLLNKCATEAESSVMLEYFKDGISFQLESHSYRKENFASIKINNVEYAVNKRGLNIVVFDPQNGVFDSVYYDTHDKQKWFGR